MESKQIDLLLLSIGDKLEITAPNFYYKIEGRYLFPEYSKKSEKGWIHCPKFVGIYCGDRMDTNSGKLKIIKIRILNPVKMSSEYHSYIEFHVDDIEKIKVLNKSKPSILNQICHSTFISNNAFNN